MIKSQQNWQQSNSLARVQALFDIARTQYCPIREVEMFLYCALQLYEARRDLVLLLLKAAYGPQWRHKTRKLLKDSGHFGEETLAKLAQL